MSEYRINIRILMWHFQVTYDWKVSWSYNRFHRKLNTGFFKVYNFDLTKRNQK